MSRPSILSVQLLFGVTHSLITVKSIGILSKIIVDIEKYPHDPKFSRSGTAFASAQCAARYDDRYPESIHRLAQKAMTDDAALEQFRKALIEHDLVFNFMLKTTQAVDLIQGGVKVNALPETASAVINHRIAEHR